MPQPVAEKVGLPTLAHSDKALQTWVGALIRNLTVILFQHGHRINNSVNTDGQVAMAAPLQLAIYTIATLPDAADWEGGVVYVSDGAAGQKFRGSDGSSWVNLG